MSVICTECAALMTLPDDALTWLCGASREFVCESCETNAEERQ